MMYSCKVIEDLLPLYCDNICSEDSKKIVEAHLEECVACRTQLGQMKEEASISDQEQKEEINETVPLKKLKKKIKKKTLLILLITVICTAIIVTGVYAAVVLVETPIKYREGLVTLQTFRNGQINALYHGGNYACVYEMQREIDVDGKKQNASFLYYSKNLYAKYFEKKSKIPSSFPIDDREAYMEENGVKKKLPKVDMIFYLAKEYDKEVLEMNDEEFFHFMKGAVLLWQR